MQTSGLHSLARHVESHPAVHWYTRHWSSVLLTLEALVASFFIYYGPLHPIDYPTYLHQARTFTVDHDLDYTRMRGPTGKLVYPALHLWIFSAFERLFGIPEHDPDSAAPWIYPQLIFLLLLLLQTKIIHQLYTRVSTQPHWDCLFFLLTVRARNVYVNGLFNDGIQVIFAYAGLLTLARNKRPALVLLLFSMSASIKMNALLWGPGLAVHYVSTLGVRTTLKACQAAVGWQLLVGLPFLVAHPVSYLSRSFQLNREFVWFNSVYWKWLPPAIFYSSSFHVLLQLCHLVLLAVFASFHLTSSADQLALPKVRPLSAKGTSTSTESPRRTIAFLATMHFAGIAFAKSLHYSFYIWYFHTLPLLYSAAGVSWLARPVLATLLEVSWNQWHSYKGRLMDGSVDQLDSCGSWRGGLGIFAVHMILVVMLIRQEKSSQKAHP